jgi:hypothetical protein
LIASINFVAVKVLARSAAALAMAVAALAPAQVQKTRYQPGWPCQGTVDPAYVDIAEATGGSVLLFAPSEIAGVAAEMTLSDRHSEVVFRASSPRAADGLHEFDIPLDSSIESVYFFLSQQCLQGVSVVGPSGEEVRADVPGVELQAFDAIRLLRMSTPVPGPWKVRVAGRGFLSVIVRAKTSLRLANVKLADPQPAAKRAPQRIEVAVEGTGSRVTFHAVSAGGDVLKPLRLELEAEDDTLRTYGGLVTMPAGDFRIAVTGTDANGFQFQRMQKTLVVK